MISQIPHFSSTLKPEHDCVPSSSQAKWKSTRVGYASRTDHPEWAMDCLRKIEVTNGMPMADVAKPLFEIYPGCKKAHFSQFHKDTGIPYR